MAWFTVNYQLYQADGTTPLYLIPLVQTDNSPQDTMSYVEIDSLRGTGSIIIPGSISSWDLDLTFIILGVDYQDVMNQVDNYLSTVQQQTKYVLKIGRTSSSSVSYNIMRLKSPKLNQDNNFRNNYIEVSQTFRINCW